ncbi:MULTISPECIES: CPBP family glutamic-type intramembrane protease [Sphingobacterium]|uniref:CPBP family glutamic-type intramembrane protease n=2 Tax=Sphingobacteriaceae TaxID=84566 RepID=UPI0009F84C47|nr:CPBP family intramembrane metalloprotease [Sphingobacterium siyangense]
MNFYYGIAYSKNQDALNKFWTYNQRRIFILSAIIFAILHYKRYNMTFENLLLIPFLLAFYFSRGWILEYARAPYGFIYSCLLHILYNFLLSVKYTLNNFSSYRFNYNNAFSGFYVPKMDKLKHGSDFDNLTGYLHLFLQTNLNAPKETKRKFHWRSFHSIHSSRLASF